MRVGERGGLIKYLTRLFAPLFKRLFPEIPQGHPAFGAMVMNLSANVLGLDNAATPLGLKAMKELQSLNTRPDTATNAQILFLVLNTSSVTLFPVTVFAFRAQQGAADPTDVFVPILIATYASTLTGLVAAAFVQKIRLWDPVVILYLAGMTAMVAGLMGYFVPLGREEMQRQSAILSNFLLFSVIVMILLEAMRNRVNVYDAFIEGAKGGFQVVITIIPFLVAMLVGIGVFRASGALDMLLEGGRFLAGGLGMDTRFVEALPTALMKPLSGSGARGLMVETMQTYGADSFPGRLAAIMQGSTETTFYVLALYFGSVGIRHGRHAIACGLLADLAGILTAIFAAYLFFG